MYLENQFPHFHSASASLPLQTRNLLILVTTGTGWPIVVSGSGPPFFLCWFCFGLRLYGFLQRGEKFWRMCLAMVLVYVSFPSRTGQGTSLVGTLRLNSGYFAESSFQRCWEGWGNKKEREERGSFSHLLIFFLSKPKVIPGILSSTYVGWW